MYSELRSKGYTDIGRPNDFYKFIEEEQNRRKLYKCLNKEGYDNFITQFELDSYLGYESVVYTCFTEEKKYHVAISYIDEFDETIPNANIIFLNEGKQQQVSIKDRNSLSDMYRDARLHLTIKINKDYKQSKRRLFYYSLLATGYLSENELGTMSEFLNTINCQEKLREFYFKLLNWGFYSSEIGSVTEFCENLSTDFYM